MRIQAAASEEHTGSHSSHLQKYEGSIGQDHAINRADF